MSIGVFSGSDVDDEYFENMYGNVKVFDFTKEVKHIKKLENYERGFITVESRTKGRINIKVLNYKESNGDEFLCAYWEEEKTLFIRQV